jgi:dihydroorotase
MTPPSTLTLTRPDDWHLHLRDGPALAAVVNASARVFGRAIVMPNLKPPVATLADARAYRARILACLSAGSRFEPLMTLYLTDRTTAADIRAARESGMVHAVKYYPAGATTHSDAGVSALDQVTATLAEMEKLGLPLLVHGEVTDPAVDVFDREQVFVDTVLDRITRDFPGLRLVVEHITTAEAAAFVAQSGSNVAATVTPQHLLYNRNAIFLGGVRPHYYCLPVLKRESHRRALVAAATSGNPKFFLGSDSAPHARHTKENACGCAGCYCAPAAIELYAQAFEQAGALDRLEAFASFHGADFYRLPRNRDTLRLQRQRWRVPDELPFGDDRIVPLAAGETLSWRAV